MKSKERSGARRGNLEKNMAVWERFYDNDRPHGAHKGKTQSEVVVEQLG
jgi:hypothetical protein